jgi:hypothetical protein
MDVNRGAGYPEQGRAADGTACQHHRGGASAHFLSTVSPAQLARPSDPPVHRVRLTVHETVSLLTRSLMAEISSTQRRRSVCSSVITDSGGQ